MINMKDIIIEKNENKKYFTKGLSQFGYLELMINLNLNKELVNQIVEIIVNKINEGEQIKNKYLNIDEISCPLYIRENENNLQIIFPDPFIKFPWESDCQELYKQQL